MKRIAIVAAVACLVASALAAATVSWSSTNEVPEYNGCLYYVFVLGEQGVANADAVTGVLDAGGDISRYAIGSGTIGEKYDGKMSKVSNYSIGTGQYGAFAILFNGANPKPGESLYFVAPMVQNSLNVPKGVTYAEFTFDTLGAKTASNWAAYAIPEPTGATLLALGLSALALRRKK